jgi:serpin B
VSDVTEGRIENLLPPGSISAATRFVLTNAIYFNAAWLIEFDEADTTDSPFFVLEGDPVEAPLMHVTEEFLYREGEDYQAIALPYDGEELEMVVLLPDSGSFEHFQSELDAERLDDILGGLAAAEVELSLPRFEFTSTFVLNDLLHALGMEEAFVPGLADFSGIDGSQDLFVSLVIHKAFVLVNEQGTEAAAATAVVVDLGVSEPSTPVMTVNRPFFFVIRDVPTGSVLFIGRVLDPTA